MKGFFLKAIVGSFFITGGLIVFPIYYYNSPLQNCLREATEVARNSPEGDERHLLYQKNTKECEAKYSW